MEISFTRWRVYRECPEKYRLHFVEGRKIKPTAKSSFGLSLHRCVEAWRDAGDDSLDALLEALDAHWDDRGFADEVEETRWRRKAERALTSWHADETSRRAKVVASEKEFIWALGAHQARGMIDRIEQRPDGAYELIDLKSGDAPSEEQLAADKQLRFYALGARRGLGLTPSWLTVDALAAGKRVTIAYDGKGEEELALDIAKAAAAIEAFDFTPDTSYCARCDFRKDCAYSVSKL